MLAVSWLICHICVLDGMCLSLLVCTTVVASEIYRLIFCDVHVSKQIMSNITRIMPRVQHVGSPDLVVLLAAVILLD